jgi:hypothetical protein
MSVCEEEKNYLGVRYLDQVAVTNQGLLQIELRGPNPSNSHSVSNGSACSTILFVYHDDENASS